MKKSTSIIDTLDIDIILHRDIHFGKNFDIMLDYYLEKKVGVMPDFPIERIQQLKKMEQSLHNPLSSYLPPTVDDIATRAKTLYTNLREIYANHEKTDIAVLISDLILSESEFPTSEINALIARGSDAVSPLIHIIQTTDFYDPLFPGYGRAPIFAAHCLAKIGDTRAIVPLFEALGQENFFTDDAIISALTQFGDKAKDFLLSRMKQKPYTKDNIHAVIALTSFPEDSTIAETCLKLLQDTEARKKDSFAHYLLFGCSGLTKQIDRNTFKALENSSDFSSALRSDMRLIIKNWEN